MFAVRHSESVSRTSVSPFILKTTMAALALLTLSGCLDPSVDQMDPIKASSQNKESPRFSQHEDDLVMKEDKLEKAASSASLGNLIFNAAMKEANSFLDEAKLVSDQERSFFDKADDGLFPDGLSSGDTLVITLCFMSDVSKPKTRHSQKEEAVCVSRLSPNYHSSLFTIIHLDCKTPANRAIADVQWQKANGNYEFYQRVYSYINGAWVLILENHVPQADE